jgi:hypothetical protein
VSTRQVWRAVGENAGPILVFLEPRCFVAKTPDSGGWISLDFLGFSRQNRDFSMGYADKAEKFFPTALSVAKEPSKRLPAIWHEKGTDCSWGKRNSISDFLQDIPA